MSRSIEGPFLPPEGAEPRICFLTDSFYPIIGGGENHARLLAREMTRQGGAVFVLTQRRLSESPRYERLDGYPVYRVGRPGMPRLGKYAMMPAAFGFLMRHRHVYDVIYICGMRTLGVVGVLCARLLGKKCVLRSESCDELRGEHLVAGAQGRPVLRGALEAWRRARNHVLLKADRFLAISDAVEQEYRENGVTEEQLTCIPNGIDTETFSPPAPGQKDALRKRLGLPDGRLVMYTGKLNRGKGLEWLLQAWKAVSKEYPEAHLVLVGSGDHQFLSCEAELRAFVEAHGLHERVTFTGATNRVADYLKAADLFVMPSESESQCISLIEAMAVELPAVATAVGGISEYFEHGCHGMLVPPRDPEALAEGLRTLLGDAQRAAAQGRQARQVVLERFCIDAVARDHGILFRELVR